ncbi:MAG: hypothetical protein IJW45_05870 [Oscillospiraceae bacterium]|nr:hypothetical protein [Oscillospiraceae bacterium]
MDRQIDTYQALNALASPGGVVIFGGSEDKRIPLCELKQAFQLREDFYDLSIADLTIADAPEFFDRCIAPLAPATLLLHLGEADLHTFELDPSTFHRTYGILLHHIKTSCKKCDIAVISLKETGTDPRIKQMNEHLRMIAESERCPYFDLSTMQLWDPKQTRDVMSFLYSTGFVRPLKQNRPLYDLVKILFHHT